MATTSKEGSRRAKIDSRLVLDFGFPPQKINLAERVANKKVILVGLPGAFTPT